MFSLAMETLRACTLGRGNLYDATVTRVRDLLEAHADAAHGMGHVLLVTAHVQKALAFSEASPSANVDFASDSLGATLGERRAAMLVLAALLHEADDAKIFKGEGYANARRILEEVVVASCPELKAESTVLVEDVVEIIDLVSTRKNKDGSVPSGDEWKLLVRDADRIEAVGDVGVARCYAYNRKAGDPLFLPSTPRVVTEAELWAVATPERFAAYKGDSASMVDHYYDKLLHLKACASGNKFLQDEMNARLQIMVDFVFEFGRTGAVDVAKLDALAAEYCPEIGRGKKRAASEIAAKLPVESCGA